METLQKIALIFTIVGALNWGLIGLFDFNLVSFLFTNEMIQKLIYSIVGLCGLLNIYILFKHLHED